MIKVLNNNYAIQDNESETSGNIYRSRNMNFDEKGKIKLAERTVTPYSQDDDADFDNVDAIFASADNIYVNGSNVFNGLMDFAAFNDRGSDTNAPSPGPEDDVIYFNGTEVVTDSGVVSYRSASTTWTTVATGLPGTSSPSCMEIFQAAAELAVAQENKVKFINASWAVNATTLTLPADYHVHTMCSVGNNLLLGTRSLSGAEAKVFVLNGSIKTSADFAYSIGTFEMFSLKPFLSTAIGVDSLGRITKYNGGGFTPVAQFPIYNKDIEWADANNDYGGTPNRGVATDGDLAFINVTSRLESGVWYTLPDFQSGVWCYDDKSGSLYHRYSSTFTKVLDLDGTNVSSVSSNTITFSSSQLTNAITGMLVMFEQDSISQITSSTPYYIIKDSATQMRLATSYANALAGTAMTISGTMDGADKIFIMLENDYGWTYHENRCAVAVLNSKLFDFDRAGRIAMTAKLGAKQAINTGKRVISGICPFIPNRGYFITPKYYSEELEDNYISATIKYKPLRNEEKIIVKYKVQERDGLPLSSPKYKDTANWRGSWSDTDTFTTTADLSDVIAGDEVEIIAGVGSGHIAHVDSISEAGGTYTVNLTEAYPFAVASDQCFFNVDSFKILKTITTSNQTDENYCHVPINKSGKFIQLKVELRGVGVTVEEVIINNNVHKPVI